MLGTRSRGVLIRMPEDLTFHSHPSADLLEIYALGTLTGEQLDEVEEHLMLCRRCQDAVEEFDNFIRATKDATGMPHSQQRSGWDAVLQTPRLLLVAATLVVVAGLVTITNRAANHSPPSVE